MTTTTKKKKKKKTASSASSSAASRATRSSSAASSSTRSSSTVSSAAPVPAGILDGNGRTARLARWLRDLPKRSAVDTLVLEMKAEDGWTRMQSWDRGEAGMHLALTIDSAVTDLANELGSYIQARCVWIESKTDAVWTEHALRAHPEGMQEKQAFSGDAQSVAIQTQRALERVLGAFLGQIETSSRLSERASEIASANYEHAAAELQLARERLVILEREKAELETELEQALQVAEQLQTAQPQQDGTAQFTTLLTSVLAQQATAAKA